METIRCRINRNLWWLVPVAIGETVFMLAAPFQIAQEQPKSSPWPIYLICGPAAVAFFGCVIYMVASLLREEVLADETGLRWRGAFGPWKSARWDEITDFYLKSGPIIETPQGKCALSSSFVNRAEMMAFIAARAVNAPAREWEMEKYRASKNLTQRFEYWTKTHTWMAPMQSLGAVYVLGFLTWGIFFNAKPTAKTPFSPAWQFDWFSVLMAIFGFGPVFALFVIMVPLIWRDRNRAFARRDEHLEISPRGLSWQRGQARIDASWQQVRAIRFVAGDKQTAHFQVETQNGDFAVWRSLESIGLWVQLVNQFAPHLAVEIPVDDPDLGKESATWSGGVVGQGARVFHFRTRDTRLVLWAATVFGRVLPALPLLMHFMKTPDDAPSNVPVKFLSIALFLIILALIYAWMCFQRAAIWANETGLEWRVPLFKNRRVNWSEIESFGRDEGTYFLIVGGKKRRLLHLSAPVSAPVRQNELRELIQTRAPNASEKWN